MILEILVQVFAGFFFLNKTRLCVQRIKRNVYDFGNFSSSMKLSYGFVLGEKRSIVKSMVIQLVDTF